MILIIGNCNTDIITRETAAAILGYVVTTVYSETGTGGTDWEEEIGIGTVVITVLWTPLDPVVRTTSRGIVAMMEGVHGTVMLVEEKTLSISITRTALHG